MPRHRPRLGQGLEALVSPARHDAPEESAELSRPPGTAPAGQHPQVTAWEYVLLAPVRRKRRRSACRLTVLPGDLLRKPERYRIRGITPLVALGLLGAGGWELVGVRGRSYILKRPARALPQQGGLRLRYLA